MALALEAVQESLAATGLDGWLLYDFHGSNPIASHLAGVGGTGVMTTRRWYYLIPATGEPVGLVHAIESHNLDGLPGETRTYAGRRSLETELERLLAGVRRVAMEYSPSCAIPYLSRVDAGTIEHIRALGVDVVSSGDLVQQFEAAWDARALASHLAASARLHRIKDRAFDAAATWLRDGRVASELELQGLMVDWFEEEGLVSDSPPVVATAANSGDPHYLPTPDRHRPICPGDVLLLDLWGRLNQPGTVFADITWVGVASSSAPDDVVRVFEVVRRARDAASELVTTVVGNRGDLRGWEVDRAARTVIDEAGFGDRFVHRTGHSLGEDVHGNGVHMDDYETHDDRRLLPGTGFTIEPGIYLEAFGVRSEINMFVGDGEARVSGPEQARLVMLMG